jgi:hypothetical protein
MTGGAGPMTGGAHESSTSPSEACSGSMSSLSAGAGPEESDSESAEVVSYMRNT